MRYLASFAIVVCFLVTMASPAQAGEPQDQLKVGIEKVIAILSDPTLKNANNQGERQAMLRAVVDSLVDWREMTKRAVAENWVKLSPMQQDDFVASFSELVQKTYIAKLEKYNNEKVVYLTEEVKGSLSFITTKVVMENKSIPVNYVMIQRHQWRVFDVLVDGVSLIKSYRTMFADILSRETPENLLQRIKDKSKFLNDGKTVNDMPTK